MIIIAPPCDTATNPSPPDDGFRAEVIRGLSLRPRELPCKYFYDEEGSRLFEQICLLPEYYLTVTELKIMHRHAADMADILGRQCLLIEYGSGSSTKTRALLDRLASPAGYVPIDISREQLCQSAFALAREYPQLDVKPLDADFTMPIALPPMAQRPGRRVVYFPGSTVGNFTRDEATALLRRTAKLCGRDGGLLIGADLKKDPRVITAAYNDRAGVTAAFNRNLLMHINRALGGDFAVEQFWHHAFYDPAQGRIEMHLVSRREQRVHVAGQEFAFAEGESIRTEYSHKYSMADLRSLATTSGFEVRHTWTDERQYFAVQFWRKTEGDGTTGD
jgi:dimethylhistidine N-methyltransferase